MKEAGIIIDLYQSPLQDEASIKKAVSDFYIPLLKTIKSNKDISFSINIPLSTLEMLDNLHFESVITDIKDLYQNDRVEILGSFPYGGDFNNFSHDIIESQIILNEYGVGYYLGSKQGFEGDPSIMTRDIIGFFPPFGGMKEGLTDILAGLGYRWSAFKVSKGNKPDDGFIKKIENSDFIISPYTDDVNDLVIELVKNSTEKDYEMKKSATYSCIDRIYKEVKDSNSDYLILNIGSIDVLKIHEEPDYKELFNVFIWTIERLNHLGVRFSSVSDLIKKTKKMSSIEQEEISVLLKQNEKSNIINDMSDIHENLCIALNHLSNAISSIKNIDSISPFKLWSYDKKENTNYTQYHLYSYLYTKISKILPTIGIYLNEEQIDDKKHMGFLFENKYVLISDIEEECQKIDSEELRINVSSCMSSIRGFLDSRSTNKI